MFFPFLSSSWSIKQDFSKTINLVAKPFLILRRFKTHLLGVCLTELDPQPDYKLFHHMAGVSPVAAAWYIIGCFKKKKEKKGKKYKPPSLLYTKPAGTSVFYYLCYFLLKIKAQQPEKKNFQKLLLSNLDILDIQPPQQTLMLFKRANQQHWAFQFYSKTEV